jgi:predicted nucleic acid-binding protein
MRLVLDCDVLVAALRSDQGASRQLTRTEHLDAAGLTAEEVGAILDGLVAVGEADRLSFRWRPVLPDPDDDMVVETAVNGRADALVTFNRRHFAVVGDRFGTEVVPPAEGLARLGEEP